MTDLIILATLLSRPKHGYQIKHEAGMILGQGILHNNLVYPLLRRFMNDKLVSRRTVPGERGQTRHRYAITFLGRKQLVARLSAFSEQ
ncbi:MAG TPA: PadR family transcriptional regulator, partial [Terriglobales bacterium]|nr:PadR family transcriptional regulator [Terriglobales bacterium]